MTKITNYFANLQPDITFIMYDKRIGFFQKEVAGKTDTVFVSKFNTTTYKLQNMIS